MDEGAVALVMVSPECLMQLCWCVILAMTYV